MKTMLPNRHRLPARALLAVTLALTTSLAHSRQFSDLEVLHEPLLPTIVSSIAFDVDADGDLDLITSHETGSDVQWWPQLGLGSREFGPPAPLGPIPNGFQTFVSGDLDGDGRDDVVSVGRTQDVIDVLWMDPGGLGAPARIDEGAAVPETSALIDLDFDGDLDVAIPSISSNNLTWIENLGGRQFAPRMEFAPIATRAVRIVVGDIDGDGDGDLLTYHPLDSIRFYRSDPSGFALAQTINSMTGSNVAFDITLSDLDLDGDLDLVVQGALPAGGTARYVASYEAMTGNFSVQAPKAGIPGSSSIFDIDGDMIPDFVFVRSNGNPGNFFRGLGNLQFGAAEPLGPASAALDPDLIQADLDADGRNDLLSVGIRGLAWIPGAPATTGPALENEARLITQRLLNVAGIASMHLDGDAFLDIVAGSSENGLQRLDGTGFGTVEFAGELDAGAREPLDELEGVDLDGDGQRDLVLRSRDDEVSWRRNLGNATFDEPLPITQLSSADGMLQTIDVDGDGDLDFLETTPGSTALSWWEQEPAGTFLAPATLLTTPNPMRDVSMGDHNGDGTQDIALTILLNGGRLRIRWLQGLGAGQFAAGETLTQLMQLTNRFHSVDLDGDGRAEIGWEDGGFASPMQVAQFNPSTGTFSDAIPFTPWESNDLVYPGDFDGDGQGDLIAIDLDIDPIRFFRGLGGLSFAAPTDLEFYPNRHRTSEVVDFDGDGDLDLLVSSSRAGDLLGFNSSIFLYRNAAIDTPGMSYCGPAVPNSTGASAAIASRGSATVIDMDLVLRSAALPPGSTTFFLGSRASDFISQPAGSQGVLCLGGSIGRFVGPGQVLSAAQNGTAELALDLTDLPQPTGGVPAVAGDTWYFQGWFRDSVAGQATSNFTDGLSLTFL